jgi:hypothetical protein
MQAGMLVKMATRAGLLCGTLFFSVGLAHAEDDMILLDRDGLVLRAHLQAGLNVVSEHNLFWNYADTFAPSAGFNANPTWLEGYVKPGLSFSKEITSVVSAYGLISMVASGTAGIDAYSTGNTGRITLEEGYLGLRSTNKDGPTFDISAGPREFKAGTGMLLANGGSSGFDRGALKLGPRKAWEQSAIGRVGIDGFTGTAFYLDANELSDTDGHTKIAGTDLRYDAGPENFAGATIGHVLSSDAPYPKAAPNGIGAPSILPRGRDGLNFTNLYGRISPRQGRFENFFVGGDFAYEWNHRINMAAWAGRVQVGYTFTEYSWTPTLSYSYQTFSGDDPSTSKLERFDPLFYEGSPSSWSTGSKSSMLFINSNVNAHQISLRVTPTDRDTFTLRYSYIDVNELRSPIQFGQATRVDSSGGVPNAITGATARHLADDIFLEYNRVLTPNIYLTAGFSVSFSGPGSASLINGNLPVWTGGFVNVVANY